VQLVVSSFIFFRARLAITEKRQRWVALVDCGLQLKITLSAMVLPSLAIRSGARSDLFLGETRRDLEDLFVQVGLTFLRQLASQVSPGRKLALPTSAPNQRNFRWFSVRYIDVT
jgi:hypothetical protein